MTRSGERPARARRRDGGDQERPRRRREPPPAEVADEVDEVEEPDGVDGIEAEDDEDDEIEDEADEVDEVEDEADEVDEVEDEADEVDEVDEVEDEADEVDEVEEPAPPRRVPARQVARWAAEQVMEMTGKESESVTSVQRTDDGWLVGLEVVESRRVPDTADLLAIYEAEMDPGGELLGYRRVRRHTRGRGEDG